MSESQGLALGGEHANHVTGIGWPRPPVRSTRRAATDAPVGSTDRVPDSGSPHSWGQSSPRGMSFDSARMPPAALARRCATTPTESARGSRARTSQSGRPGTRFRASARCRLPPHPRRRSPRPAFSQVSRGPERSVSLPPSRPPPLFRSPFVRLSSRNAPRIGSPGRPAPTSGSTCTTRWTGIPGATRPSSARATKTGRSWSRSATAPATGVT